MFLFSRVQPLANDRIEGGTGREEQPIMSPRLPFVLIAALILAGLVPAILTGGPPGAGPNAWDLMDPYPEVRVGPREPFTAPVNFAGSLKGARLVLEGESATGEGLPTVRLFINGEPVTDALPLPSGPFDIGDHLISGEGNVLEIQTVDGSPPALMSQIRVVPLYVDDQDKVLASRIEKAFDKELGRRPRASEMALSLEMVRKEGNSFFGRIKDLFRQLFPGRDRKGFSEREVMEFKFARLHFGPRLSYRIRHTPVRLLSLLGERARFTLEHDRNLLSRLNANKILKWLQRLDVPAPTPIDTVPGGPNPPPNPPQPPPSEEPSEPGPPPPAEDPPNETPEEPTDPSPPPEVPPEEPADPSPPPEVPPEEPTDPSPPPEVPPEEPTQPPEESPEEPVPPPDEPPEEPPEDRPDLPDEPADGSVLITQYYPLALGNRWSFTDTAAGDDFDTVITEQVDVDGVKAFKQVKEGTADYDILSSGDAGVLLHARNDANGYKPWKPPVVFAPYNARVGETYKTEPEFRNPATGNTMVWTVKFVGRPDVSTPAGTFEKCVRLKIQLRDSGLGTKLANFEMYLARGVGLVKRQGQFFGKFFVQVLTGYDLK